MSARLTRLVRRLDGRGPVRLRPVDLVAVLACALASIVLLGSGLWAPGAVQSALFFGLMPLALLVLRLLESVWPRSGALTFVADFWLLPVVTVGHNFLNPVVDSVRPVLVDAQLVAMDERLFGAQAAVVLSQVVPPWLMEVLMVCYYGHFIWSLLLGLLLHRPEKMHGFNEYLLGLGIFFIINYTAYVLVPAIGPRFFLFGAFSGPVQGLFLTPLLDGLMRQPTFVRDCFPSGHTGAALMVLFYAWRFARPFFWVMLLPAVGLITATLAGRFHYATDLVFAVPLVVVAVGLSRALCRALARREERDSERSVPADAIVRP